MIYKNKITKIPQENILTSNSQRRALNAVMAALDAQEGIVVLPEHHGRAGKVITYRGCEALKDWGVLSEQHTTSQHVENRLKELTDITGEDLDPLNKNKIYDVSGYTRAQLSFTHANKKGGDKDENKADIAIIPLNMSHPEQGYIVALRAIHGDALKDSNEARGYQHSQEHLHMARYLLDQKHLNLRGALMGEHAASLVQPTEEQEKAFLIELAHEQQRNFTHYSKETQGHVGNVGRLFSRFIAAEMEAHQHMVTHDQQNWKTDQHSLLASYVSYGDAAKAQHATPYDLRQSDNYKAAKSIAHVFGVVHDIGKLRMSPELLRGGVKMFDGEINEVEDHIVSRNMHAMAGRQILGFMGDERSGALMRAATAIAGMHHMHDKPKSLNDALDSMHKWRRSRDHIAQREGLAITKELDDWRSTLDVPPTREQEIGKIKQVRQEIASTVTRFKEALPPKFAYPIYTKEQTPFEAKMLAVVDVFEAVCAKRHYQSGKGNSADAGADSRRQRTPAEALDILVDMANKGEANAAAVHDFIRLKVYDAILHDKHGKPLKDSGYNAAELAKVMDELSKKRHSILHQDAINSNGTKNDALQRTYENFARAYSKAQEYMPHETFLLFAADEKQLLANSPTHLNHR